MSEPLIFHDYEFHFTSGQLLCVTMQQGRDTLHINPASGEMVLTRRESEDLEVEMIVHMDKLDATQITRRTVKPEAQTDER